MTIIITTIIIIIIIIVVNYRQIFNTITTAVDTRREAEFIMKTILQFKVRNPSYAAIFFLFSQITSKLSQQW